jgi:phage terminase large subunit
MNAPLCVLFICPRLGEIRRLSLKPEGSRDSFERSVRAMLRIIRRAWADSLTVEIEKDRETVATFSGIKEATPKAIVAKLLEVW